MLTIDLGSAAWALAALAGLNGLVRLLFGLLAAHAARKALDSPTPSGGGAAERLGAHRLAVLRALLNGFNRHRG